MSSILIVGATRGLGASLVKKYLESGWTVYGTTRSVEGPKTGDAPAGVKWIPNIDLMEKNVGTTIADYLGTTALDAVVR